MVPIRGAAFPGHAREPCLCHFLRLRSSCVEMFRFLLNHAGPAPPPPAPSRRLRWPSGLCPEGRRGHGARPVNQRTVGIFHPVQKRFPVARTAPLSELLSAPPGSETRLPAAAPPSSPSPSDCHCSPGVAAGHRRPGLRAPPGPALGTGRGASRLPLGDPARELEPARGVGWRALPITARRTCCTFRLPAPRGRGGVRENWGCAGGGCAGVGAVTACAGLGGARGGSGVCVEIWVQARRSRRVLKGVATRMGRWRGARDSGECERVGWEVAQGSGGASGLGRAGFGEVHRGVLEGLSGSRRSPPGLPQSPLEGVPPPRRLPRQLWERREAPQSQPVSH